MGLCSNLDEAMKGEVNLKCFSLGKKKIYKPALWPNEFKILQLCSEQGKAVIGQIVSYINVLVLKFLNSFYFSKSHSNVSIWVHLTLQGRCEHEQHLIKKDSNVRIM